MLFQYSGGTPRQVDWAKEGVQSCNFPLDKIAARVTFQWVDQLPQSDTPHPYMETAVDNTGAFTVFIASWADDYTNPNLQGLPNPAQDVKQFYMESVVHELGHVVSVSTFLGDFTKMQKICSLFWTATVDSGTGVRYGTIADFSSSSAAWGALIKEAVADVFKCAFFTMPSALIFKNRTIWNISSSAWADFLALISPVNLISGVRTALNGLADDAVTAGQGFLAPTPIPADGGLLEGTATGGGTIAYAIQALASGQQGEVDYSSLSTVSWLSKDTNGVYKTAKVPVEASQNSFTIAGPTGQQTTGSWSPSQAASLGTDPLMTQYESTVQVKGNGLLGAVVLVEYSVRAEFDVVHNGVPTGDYFAVTLRENYGVQPSNDEEILCIVEFNVGGVHTSNQWNRIIYPGNQLPPEPTETFTLMFFPIYTNWPVEAPYPFHNGTLNVEPGLRGGVILGH